MMARRQIPIFLGTEHDHRIEVGVDDAFLLLLKTGLLLALKENGIIDLMQYKYAEESLRRNLHHKSGSEMKYD